LITLTPRAGIIKNTAIFSIALPLLMRSVYKFPLWTKHHKPLGEWFEDYNKVSPLQDHMEAFSKKIHSLNTN